MPLNSLIKENNGDLFIAICLFLLIAVDKKAVYRQKALKLVVQAAGKIIPRVQTNI